MLGAVLLAEELSPTYISPRFMARIQRLAGVEVGEGGFLAMLSGSISDSGGFEKQTSLKDKQ